MDAKKYAMFALGVLAVLYIVNKVPQVKAIVG